MLDETTIQGHDLAEYEIATAGNRKVLAPAQPPRPDYIRFAQERADSPEPLTTYAEERAFYERCRRQSS